MDSRKPLSASLGYCFTGTCRDDDAAIHQDSSDHEVMVVKEEVRVLAMGRLEVVLRRASAGMVRRVQRL